MSQEPVSTVLFDLGDVLFRDPWETLLLTERTGLADRLGLDREKVAETGRKLWHRFSLTETNEQDYWKALSRRLGQPVSPFLIRELEEELLLANPAAETMLSAAADRRIGIVSNNTTFWYAKQSGRLRLDKWIDPTLVLLSCREGVSKGTPGEGLFERAARHVDPATTLIVEDRPRNITRARSAGFRTLTYSFSASSGVMPQELLDIIRG
ncbi:HAD-IA family hydrolase [Streptomyces sp. NPDC004539]|uniref:HAD family hydrolase n=1 Tax=Streptomyces sp. NPDC004539 TaxID=3154280 RepID=UPI0033A7E50B